MEKKSNICDCDLPVIVSCTMVNVLMDSLILQLLLS